MALTRYKLLIEYCGTGFAGFQKLSHKRTVQAELERAYARLCGHPVQIWGAGRTDTGVHALGQVVAFDSENPRTPEQVVLAGNIMLPADIRVLQAEVVAGDFHPRHNARSRTYRYLVANTRPDPLLSTLAWTVPDPLDLEAMQAGARKLVGQHDFTAFSSRPDSERRRRTLLHLEVGRSQPQQPGPAPLDRLGAPFLWIEVRGLSFLRRMVRMIVAGLVRVGTGALTPGDLETILQADDSSAVGPPAPPAGLYLVSVEY